MTYFKGLPDVKVMALDQAKSRINRMIERVDNFENVAAKTLPHSDWIELENQAMMIVQIAKEARQ